MNQLGLIIIVVPFLFFCANAQYTSTPVDPNLAVVISALSAVFLVLILIFVFSEFCPMLVSNILTNHRNTNERFGLSSRLSGIDKTVIESIPFFKFSSLKGFKEGLECVVCLSKFDDTEMLRLLPICRHAFHMKCIDRWLERHSSCPLCRYKFDLDDLTGFNYTNSLRYHKDSFNLSEDPNRELFVQREEEHNQSSSRFNLEGTSFWKFGKGKKDYDDDRKLLHNCKHKIIVSDIVYRSRWSDVKYSDLMFLNSEMINFMSSKRFSQLDASSGRFHNGFLMNENTAKIKEFVQRKTLSESKVSKITRSNSLSASSFPSTSNIEENQSIAERSLRTMSDVGNLPRFTEYRMEEYLLSGNSGKDEGMRRHWLSIARTVQWLGGQQRSSHESDSKSSNSSIV